MIYMLTTNCMNMFKNKSIGIDLVNNFTQLVKFKFN